MDAQAYIMSQLERLKAPVVLEVPKDDAAMVDFIYSALMSKKFRKYASSEAQQKSIRDSIRLNVAAGASIKFVLPFGGYKLWRFDESPEVDWAELFMLMYHARWLKSVADVYAPGVWFDFSSDEAIIERMNNIPRSDTDAYTKSFRDLVLFLSKYSSKNLQFTLTPVRDRYTDGEFEEELQQQIELLEQKYRASGGYATLSDRKKDMIDLNVRPLSNKSGDPLWREKNNILHDAYAAMSRRRPYMTLPEKIAVFPTLLPYSSAIAVGTTKNSIAKFWVGVGALLKREDGFIETVLSPSQLEKTDAKWQSVAIKGLEGKNFKKVRII